MQTQVPTTHPNAVKVFTVKTFGRIVQAAGFMKNLCGPMESGQGTAQDALEGRTKPTMPIVKIADLSKTPGDRVSVTLFDTISGEPIMGNRNIEGTEEKMVSSSQEMMLNQMAKGVDAGKEMDQKRINYQLLPLAESQLSGYFPRAYNQSALVHFAGGRGTQTGRDWVIPLATAAKFSEVMINPVLAPTYNRHWVIDGSALVPGGQQLASIDSTDTWTLDHIDAMATLWDELEYPMQPIMLEGDEANTDNPIKGVLYLTPKQMQQLTTQNTGRNWAEMVKMAYTRKTHLKQAHPLFDGEPGVWKGVLIKQLPVRHTISWLPGENVKIITAANRLSATETTQAVNGSLTAGYKVERAIFLGGQALGYLMGGSKSNNWWFELRRRKYDYDQGDAMAGFTRMGMQKLRFEFTDANGDKEPTDYGVMAFDSAVKA
jgi:N4-gp56 family major capsid protein